MSSYKLKVDVEILAIIDTFLLLFLIAMILTPQHSGPYCLPPIMGEMVYLKNISNPTDPDSGVWFKIDLENPKYAEIGSVVLRVFNGSRSTRIMLRNFTKNENQGLFVDVVDENGNGVIDTGDRFHIYGWVLRGYTLRLYINGVPGFIISNVPG